MINETGSWVELLGIATLLLACKFQEVEIHMVDEFVYHANARYESQDVLDAEVRICSALRPCSSYCSCSCSCCCCCCC